MVCRKRAEEKDVRAFKIYLHNNNLAVESYKHTDTHIDSDTGTHTCTHTPQISFCSLGIAPAATLHSHIELFSCLTGSREAVNRPGACQEAG